MYMEEYKKFKTEDFINDERFVSWVLKPDLDGDIFFANLQEEYPDLKSEIISAAYLVKAMQPVEPEISGEKLSQIWENANVEQPAKTRFLFGSILKYAAVFIFFLVAGGVFYLMNRSNQILTQVADIESDERGQIILSDGSIKYFDTDETVIKQLETGDLTINDDTLARDEQKYANQISTLNHIIIPYGMQSEVMLQDGSHIYLNSGSKLSYPAKFTKNEREIYLSGEAFIDVKKDKSRPFYVYTDDVKIRVLGTSFNVSSYSNDKTTQIVLLEGSVRIRKNNFLSKGLDIKPGERCVFTKVSSSFTTDKVDVRLYSSWIHGYLIFNKAPLEEVTKKLERFYNRKIMVSKELHNITFSGKLDLNEEIENSLEYISFASSLKIEKDKDCLILKK